MCNSGLGRAYFELWPRLLDLLFNSITFFLKAQGNITSFGEKKEIVSLLQECKKCIAFGFIGTLSRCFMLFCVLLFKGGRKKARGRGAQSWAGALKGACRGRAGESRPAQRPVGPPRLRPPAPMAQGAGMPSGFAGRHARTLSAWLKIQAIEIDRAFKGRPNKGIIANKNA